MSWGTKVLWKRGLVNAWSNKVKPVCFPHGSLEPLQRSCAVGAVRVLLTSPGRSGDRSCRPGERRGVVLQEDPGMAWWGLRLGGPNGGGRGGGGSTREPFTALERGRACSFCCVGPSLLCWSSRGLPDIPFLLFLLKEPHSFRWSASRIPGCRFACSRKGRLTGKSILRCTWLHPRRTRDVVGGVGPALSISSSDASLRRMVHGSEGLVCPGL